MAAKRKHLKLVTAGNVQPIPPYAPLETPTPLPAPIRGRWLTKKSYADLRNAAWFVRNYRMLGHDDTPAIAKLTYAARLLIEAGEPIESVVPSLVDLFLRP